MSNFNYGRMPTRPLSYANINIAMPKELVVDYTKGLLYVVGADGTQYSVSETMLQEIMQSQSFQEAINIKIVGEGAEGTDLSFTVQQFADWINGKVNTTSTKTTKLETIINDTFNFTVDGGTGAISGISLKPDKILQSANYRFVTDADKERWDAGGGGSTATFLNATITTTWTATGGVAPFTQQVNITDILATDKPIIDIVLSDGLTYEESQLKLRAWGSIYRISTFDGYIKVYSNMATTSDISIQLRIDR